MSDVMFYGVLRMPYEMAMEGELSRRQFYSRAKEAADRVEKLERENEELRSRLGVPEPAAASSERTYRVPRHMAVLSVGTPLYRATPPAALAAPQQPQLVSHAELSELLHQVDIVSPETLRKGLKLAIDTLAEIANAPQQDDKRDGWISVSEQLPEDGTSVAIFDPENDAMPVRTALWMGGSCTWESEQGWLAMDEVTHWMPLPEAPRALAAQSGKDGEA